VRVHLWGRTQLTLAVLACLMLGFHQRTFAQTDTGSISGVVTDASGAVIPQAKVTLRNSATGTERVISTNSRGVYSAPNIPPGTYTLTVTRSGFKTSVISNIGVELQRAVTANVVMQVGVAVSRVTVSASAAHVQTTSSAVAQLLPTQPLVQLPTNGRAVLSLVALAPGAAPGGINQVNPGDSSFFGTTGNQLSVAGMPDMSTLFLQDGVENVNMLTVTMNIGPDIESIQEVSTIMNGASAKYSQPSVVNIITKGGTNQFHGTAYDFLQNDAFDARQFFTPSGSVKPAVRYNQFGGNLGGPVLKNKVFGFFDYSGLRSSVGGPALAVVPTQAERQGDFPTDQTIYNPLTLDTATGAIQPFPGNVIPASIINPFATKFVGLYPLPNLNPAANEGNNYGTNISDIANYNAEQARADWDISPADRFYASVLHLNSPSVSPTIIPGLFGPTHTDIGTNADAEETHVFSPQLVNIAKIGYNRADYFLSQQGAGVTSYAQEYGLTNVSALASQSAPPTVSIANISSFGNPYTPQGDIQNRFQFEDELDWTRGKHMLFMGAEVIRQQFFGDWTINNNAQYAFTGAMTALYAKNPATGALVESPTDSGNGLADLLLGYPTTGSHSLGVTAGHFFSTTAAGYAGDTWKFRPKVTLDLGLRYAVFTPPVTAEGTSYNFETQQNQPGVWPTNYGDIAPRVGFAYTLTPSTVLRGGFGIYYTENAYNNEQFELTYPPNYVSQGYTETVETPVSIQNFFLPTPVPGERGYTNNPNQMKDTSVQEWNLTFERQLSPNTTLTAAYVGDAGRHGVVRYDGNQPYAATSGSLILNVLPIPALGEPIETEATLLNSNYNALMLTLNRHFGDGLSLLANYTWGRAFDYADGDNDVVENIYDMNDVYGPSGFDQPQVLNVSGVYQFPLGPGKRFLAGNRWLGDVLGDWQASGIWSIAKAPPSPVSASNLTDTSYITQFWATKVCNPYAGSFQQTLGDWFDTSCFIQPPAGTYGIGGRTGIRGPHSDNVDLSLSKLVPITERSQLQVRADFFNLFNHPQFILGGQSVTSPTFGAISSADSQRIIQLSLRYSF
jgi:hypothetical protein